MRNTSSTLSECSKERLINGTIVHVGIHPSKVVSTRLKLDKDHKRSWKGRQVSTVAKEKGKHKKRLRRGRSRSVSYTTSIKDA